MSKLKILVIEDDLSFSIELEMILSKEYDLIGIVKSVDKALAILANQEVDLILSDIFLEGEKTGVDLAVQMHSKNIPIILMTFSKDESLFQKSKSDNLLAYLIKPFDALTLRSTIELAMPKIIRNPESIDSIGAQFSQEVYKNSFFIRTNKKLVKVIVSEIKWIQSDGNYCIVVTKDRKYAIKLSLIKVLKKLPDTFIQVHKSYLVQVSYISRVDSTANQLNIDGETIPIGRKYKPALLEQLGRLI